MPGNMALSVQGGRVIINRGFDDGDETAPESFRMEWREREAVPSNRPRAMDFGRSVTDQILTRALNATVQMDFVRRIAMGAANARK
jgi:two-component system, chemotaxis family, CheB/CheR fusion protein